MMRGGNREMRRMLDRMGLEMKEVNNVQEVVIKTDTKEIVITKPAVTEMKGKDNSIFQVIADSYEERELEVPVFSQEDIILVAQQANVSQEEATKALTEAKGDLARAILLLTTK
jgi:nascent polypeptide-associated complex subunit alpha